MSAALGVILAAHGSGDGSPVNVRIRALAPVIAARVGLPVAIAFNLGHLQTSSVQSGSLKVASGKSVAYRPGLK